MRLHRQCLEWWEDSSLHEWKRCIKKSFELNDIYRCIASKRYRYKDRLLIKFDLYFWACYKDNGTIKIKIASIEFRGGMQSKANLSAIMGKEIDKITIGVYDAWQATMDDVFLSSNLFAFSICSSNVLHAPFKMIRWGRKRPCKKCGTREQTIVEKIEKDLKGKSENMLRLRKKTSLLFFTLNAVSPLN